MEISQRKFKKKKNLCGKGKHLSISSPEDESGFPQNCMSSVRGKEADPAAPSNNLEDVREILAGAG